MRALVILVLLAACASTQRRPRDGAIAGLARDHDSGDPVAMVDIAVRPVASTTTNKLSTQSNNGGLYDIDHLPPGQYHLHATFAGQPLDVKNIDVRRGETTYVDLTFTLGRPDPILVVYGDRAAAIKRYRPTRIAPSASIIEGTVGDLGTRERIVGAVVTAENEYDQTEQTITDEHGRFRFENLMPGTYAVSAYYNIGGRGQIEVRRSEIAVAATEAVDVPLWVELVK